MGRYKLGPQGTYWDPNDSGPDQASPDQIAQFQKTQQPVQPNTGYQPPTGGINPGGGNIRPVPLPPGVKLPDMPLIPQPHTGPWMPQITPNPEFEEWYAQRQASGLTFPQIMDEWQAQHPQKPGNSLASVIGQAIGKAGGYQPQTGGINPWGTMGGLQMLGPKALL